jgi:CubicO group peptidase (beta-lactamase class C family)
MPGADLQDVNPVTLANWQEPPHSRWSFQHVRELIPTARISRGLGLARRLPRSERELNQLAFAYSAGELTVGEWLAGSFTDGFLVLHQGRVIAEQYFNGLTPDTPHLLMSVSKSVTSTIAGILAGRGALELGAPVEAIAPELAGTSFAGATVQHLLDMRTGTRFSEDYADLQAEVRAYELVYLWRPRDDRDLPEDAVAYFGTLVNDGPHGGPFRYRSVLTDVLALVIERAAGARLNELIGRELWQPMGAEFDAEITVDARGNPMADGGISATLRDLGRFGQLFCDGGLSGYRQVVPAAWIEDTIAGAADGLGRYELDAPEPDALAAPHYRNCWWVRDPGQPFFYASGIHGQRIFVHEPSRVVVVKLSTWPTPLSDDLSGQTIAAVRAIAAALSEA